MHRSILSRSITLGRTLGRTSISSSPAATFARPSSLRRLLPSRPLSSSPSPWTSSKEDPSPISETSPPSTSSTKEGESELEPELESVPLPSLHDSVPSTSSTSEAVGSPSMGDILEEIGSEMRETPEESDPLVGEDGSLASEPPLAATESEAVASENSTRDSQSTPPEGLDSGRLIIGVADFSFEKGQSRLANFITAPPSTEYEIVDPDADDLVPPINYFALWPQLHVSNMAEQILKSVITSPSPPRPPPSHVLDPSTLVNFPPSPRSIPPQHLLHQTHRWLTSVHSRRNPHVTIIHDNVASGLPPDHPYSLIWDRFSYLSLQPHSPEYLIRFDNLVWDGHVMILTVDSIELIVKEGMDEDYIGLWTLPPTVDKRFHLTVLRGWEISPAAPAELLRRFRFLEGVKNGTRVIGEKEREGTKAWAKVDSVSLMDGPGALRGPYETRAKFAARQLD
ncbi:hypothetical protein BDY24DRAFT_264645 [Mrakia frigida]|uniref:uncharacterized protein n=1 Tax=Mrakia frigida TaxID=29902 RepID=UPI003FCC1101